MFISKTFTHRWKAVLLQSFLAVLLISSLSNAQEGSSANSAESSNSVNPHAAMAVSQDSNEGSSMPQNQEQPMAPMAPEKALSDLKFMAGQIALEPIRYLPVQHNGRIKPFDSLAREAVLFLNGSYQRLGVHPVQLYLGLIRFEGAAFAEIVEIRDVNVRTELGFLKEKRFYSLADLQGSRLGEIGNPLIAKQQENSKALSPRDKAVLEALQQASLLSEVISGQHLMLSADYTILNTTGSDTTNSQMPKLNQDVQNALKNYIQSVNLPQNEQMSSAEKLIGEVKKQTVPDIFTHYLDKMTTEVHFNDWQLFFWSAMTSLLFGIAFFMPLFRNKISQKITLLLYAIPLALLILGLSLRIYITQFAPVTNMYTTMVWVALGVMTFSLLLFGLYKNYVIPGITLIASGIILLLTHQIPLILSPDMDPIVAVLRNNFWLSTHVTTITISYAAFTIAMVFGNVMLFRIWFYKDNQAFIKEYSHYAYRMIQLGCFLLTIGIILGGVWADYSWGRFWGWDPKETWALIADLGFLALLHARYIGWITPFSLLAWSPAAYLLVIMAWYGVNFVLAAGLHSYGFSSGGASAMAIFVVIQLTILAFGFLRIKKKPSPGET